MDTGTRELRTALEKWSRSFEPRLLDGSAAAIELKRVARMEAICAAVKTRLAHRVDETNAWRQGGHKSAAHYVARQTGTSIHQAVVTLETAKHLDDLPTVADAFASGRVTQTQVNEIAPAAAAAPEREFELVALAEDAPHHADLRDRCRRVTADATDALARHEAIHRARAVRTWTDTGGTWHLHANGTPSDGARIMARLHPEIEAVFAEARANRKNEEREPIEAYKFDALVRIAEITGAESVRAPAHILVNVDVEKLTDGDAADGVCEIKGVGPVPVATARELMCDALLTILVKKGVDVVSIAHDGTKSMPIAVRRAVLARESGVRGRHLRRPHRRGPPPRTAIRRRRALRPQLPRAVHVVPSPRALRGLHPRTQRRRHLPPPRTTRLTGGRRDAKRADPGPALFELLACCSQVSHAIDAADPEHDRAHGRRRVEGAARQGRRSGRSRSRTGRRRSTTPTRRLPSSTRS
jgi:uncharacterized protein DUF222